MIGKTISHYRITDQIGKEIRSASNDGLVCSWDVPEGTPIHTLPYPEFMKILCSQTNMRIVLDVGAEEGYRVA